jgi:hypothetical protein
MTHISVEVSKSGSYSYFKLRLINEEQYKKLSAGAQMSYPTLDGIDFLKKIIKELFSYDFEDYIVVDKRE